MVSLKLKLGPILQGADLGLACQMQKLNGRSQTRRTVDLVELLRDHLEIIWRSFGVQQLRPWILRGFALSPGTAREYFAGGDMATLKVSTLSQKYQTAQTVSPHKDQDMQLLFS